MTDSIIDVLIAVDAATIISKVGTNNNPNSPVGINAGYIYMITAQGNVVAGQAGGELNLNARVDDVIRWRETSLSLNSDYSAILYGFQATQGGKLISNPEPRISTVTVPVANPDNCTQPTFQTIQEYFWTSDVLATGSVTYHFNFMIVDRSGAVQGYYWWDPFITISA